MRRFIADMSWYIVVAYVVFSMFIPLYKEEVVKNGVVTFNRLSLSNGYMWTMVLFFLFLAILFQVKKMRGYSSFLSGLAAIADGIGIALFCDQQNYNMASYSHEDSLIYGFSSFSGVTKVTITKTSYGLYFVIAAVVLLAAISIINLVVKNDG